MATPRPASPPAAILNLGAFARPALRQGWLGLVCIWAYGSAGALAINIQPLIFAPLASQGAITERQMGMLTGGETLCLTAGAVLAAGWLRRGGFQPKLMAAALAVTACNLTSALPLGFGQLLLLRLACGLAEGVMLSGAGVIILAGRHPERMTAAFLAVSNLIAAAIAFILPTWLIPCLGPASSFLIMALAASTAALASTRLHLTGTRPLAPAHLRRSCSPPACLALFGVVLQNAAIMIAWSFMGVLAAREGVSNDALGLSLSSNVVAQVATAAIIALVIEHIGVRSVMGVGSGLLVAAIGLIYAARADVDFLAANLLLGVAWSWVLVASIRFILNVDPQGEAIYLTCGAQMTGLSLGPMLVSLLSDHNDVRAAYGLAIILAAVALVTFHCVYTQRR